jgi:hypothetical protein
LEYWNDGVMGFGKTGKWVIDKIYLDRIVKKNHKQQYSLKIQHVTIPTFHYFYPVKLFSISLGPCPS